MVIRHRWKTWSWLTFLALLAPCDAGAAPPPEALATQLLEAARRGGLIPGQGPADRWAEVANQRGILAFGVGNWDAAEARFAEALEGRLAFAGPGDETLALFRQNLELVFTERARIEAVEEEAADPYDEGAHEHGLFYYRALSYSAYERAQTGDPGVTRLLIDTVLEAPPEALTARDSRAASTWNNLGLAYGQLAETESAEDAFLRALDLETSLSDPDERILLAIHSNLGLVHDGRSDLRRAEAHYLRSLALNSISGGENSLDRALLANNLAALYADMDRAADATTLLGIAEEIYVRKKGVYSVEVARALRHRGDLALRIEGDLAKAERLYRRAHAISHARLPAGHPDLALSWRALGLVAEKAGDYRRAEFCYRRAQNIMLRSRESSHPSLRLPLADLGRLHQEQGDYAEAERLQREALDLAVAAFGQHHPEVATDRSLLASIYVEVGDLDRAEELYTDAYQDRVTSLGEEHVDVAYSLNSLGSLFATRYEYEQARDHFEQALSIAISRLGDNHPFVLTVRNNLAMVLEDLGDAEGALVVMRQVLTGRELALGPSHPDVAHSKVNIAAQLTKSGEIDEAQGLLREALATYENSAQRHAPDRAWGLRWLADVHILGGDLDAAIRTTRRAEDLEEEVLRRFLLAGSQQRRRHYLATLAAETEMTVSLHLVSAPKRADAAEVALTAILRHKGRLQESQVDAIGAIRRSLDPAGTRLLEELQVLQAELAAGARTREGAQPGQARLEALEAELAERSAVFRGRTADIRITSILREIPDHAALLEIYRFDPYEPGAPAGEVWGEARYAAYLLGSDGSLTWADLGRAEAIDERVVDLRTAIAAQGDCGPTASALWGLLLTPFSEALSGTDHLLISPDGPLNLLPFEVLVSPDGRYLAETTQVTLLSSGRDLLRFDGAPEPRDPPLVLADPNFDAPPLTVHGTEPGGDLGSLRTWTRLEGTAAEAQALRAALESPRIMTGDRATKEVLARAHGPRILHVATHGFFDAPGARPARRSSRGAKLLFGTPGDEAEDPPPNAYLNADPMLRSGLVLAGANRSRVGSGGGYLTALELSGLDLWGTQLAVLSACDTGVGEVRSGDGIYGLRRALVLAGSQTQVISLWEVPDLATADLMADFYAELAAGKGRSESLRAARLRMQQTPGRSHPWYWAAFVLSGDWTAMSPPAGVKP